MMWHLGWLAMGPGGDVAAGDEVAKMPVCHAHGNDETCHVGTSAEVAKG